MSGQSDKTLLRAKYLDYCSARMADALLRLSPEEIFALAESEAKARDLTAPRSYREAIRLATKHMRGRMSLPRYADWIKAYSKDPAQFEPFLLGLWKTEVGDHL